MLGGRANMDFVPVLRAVAFGTLVLGSGCSPLEPSGPQAFTGVVETLNGQPVAGALVRLQGTSTSTVTGADGRYGLPVQLDGAATHITAWKEGYYIGGASLASSNESYLIQLKALPTGDNPEYRWLPARTSTRSVASDETGKPCETCHHGEALPVVREWESSAHARAATNPFFLAFFNGGSRDVPLLPRIGYRLDFPGSAGNCANCHVPALALRRPYDADPNVATGVEREGVLCDLCHKVRQVEVDLAGGRAGVLSLAFTRPAQGEQMFFGPYDDVYPGPDSLHPLYKDSRYCAGCHHGLFWGVPAYSEFAEWQASAYAEKGIHCQDCHMRPDGKTSQFAVASEGGIVRRPETIPSHKFPGRDDLALMRSGIEAESNALIQGDRLRVQVRLRNTGAGHHVPTGSPMRNMVLLVEARDASGRLLEQVDGERIPQWAGEGPEEFGNYAGLPGKGYAKILSTPVAYPADPRLGDGRAPIYPAPHWRRFVVESDDRIPAGGEDATAYIFRMGPEVNTAHVRIQLLHRRTFRIWFEAEAKFDGDLTLFERNQSLQR
ncbi:MAG: hypothetical protein A2V78_04855 [Betaproteobacteria bacterium RBG_16_64_18]|nr:MAG: hypothetical protein A2V78_04855 [Betaproteobacteria bacterium RBG_16_64_18]